MPNAFAIMEDGWKIQAEPVTRADGRRLNIIFISSHSSSVFFVTSTTQKGRCNHE